jgi:tetratricopeptide (TPR) repeat protein
MRMARRCSAAGLLAAWLVLAPGAHAAPSPREERASELFQEGRAHFRAQDYAEAARAFEASTELSMHPVPLVNAAQAWKLAGDLPAAMRALDRALAMSNLEPHVRGEATTLAAEIAPRISTLVLEGDATVSVRVDGGDALNAPARMRLSPGRHQLMRIGPSGTLREELVLAAGETVRMVLSDAPRSEGGERREEERSTPALRESGVSGPPLGSYVSFGVAAACAGGAVLFGLSTLDRREAYLAGDDAAEDAFYRDRVLTNVFAGAAITAAIVGGVLWIVDGPKKGTAPSARLAGPGAVLVHF